MTKEELKQQFYKYIKDHEDYFDPREPWTERIILQIWLDCAEPREKRIAELEAQIEKMQNCRNCKNEKIEGACGHFTQVGWCRDWKLAD